MTTLVDEMFINGIFGSWADRLDIELANGQLTESLKGIDSQIRFRSLKAKFCD